MNPLSFPIVSSKPIRVAFCAEAKEKLSQQVVQLCNTPSTLLEGLKTLKVTPTEMTQALTEITAAPELAKPFIKAMTANPNQSQILKTVLMQLVGRQNFKTWYTAPHGYKEAYAKYAKEFLQSATVEDLIRHAPTWWFFHYSNRALATTGSRDFALGSVPQGLGSPHEFQEVLAKIHETVRKHFTEWKEAGKLNPTDHQDYKLMVDTFKAAIQFTPMTINGQPIQIESMPGTLSRMTKFVFKLTAAEADGKNRQYILKIDPLENYPFLDADTVSINAVVEYYAQENGSKNSNKLLYYNSKYNAALYPYYDPQRYKPILETPKTLKEYRQLLPTLANVGIICHNPEPKNVVVSPPEEGSHAICYDMGNAAFFDIWKPLQKESRELPNNCANNYLTDALALKSKC